MPPLPSIPVELWNQIPPAAQAAILVLVQQYVAGCCQARWEGTAPPCLLPKDVIRVGVA
jgi:hypothetical protein